jgi:hypothetical protein
MERTYSDISNISKPLIEKKNKFDETKTILNDKTYDDNQSSLI